MTSLETLKTHVTKLQETKTEIETTDKKLKSLAEEWKARTEAFNDWFQKETGITGQDVLVPEMILKWSEKNDRTPTN